MRMFITPEDKVAINEWGEVEPDAITADMDVVWIYPVMPFGVQQRVMGRAATIKAVQGKRRKGQPTTDASYDIGAYRLALLECNILGWQGPSFRTADGKAVACTPDRVRSLNASMPLIAKVLEEIGIRNDPADDEEEDAGDGDGAMLLEDGSQALGDDAAGVLVLPNAGRARR